MVLLLQLYAPEDLQQYAFHRMIYIFSCKNDACHKRSIAGNVGSMKAIRCQSSESCDMMDVSTVPCDNANFCNVCGLKAEKRCAKCKTAVYCSKAHQEFDWRLAGHDKLCGRAEVEENMQHYKRSSLTYPLHYIVSELDDESDEECEELSAGLQSSLALTPANGNGDWVAGDTEQWNEEDFEQSEAEVDKAFLKFQKRTSRFPDQVLRYSRLERDDDTHDIDSEPLWISDQQKAKLIPNCIKCGGERSFEFQLMPQLLNHLGLNHADPNSLDFGVICIYTCHQNCDISPLNYVEEYIYRQDCSNEGMGNEFKEKRFGLQKRPTMTKQ